MKILLTGASSYVGARLFLDLGKQFDVLGTYHGSKLSEKLVHLDVTDAQEIKTVVGDFKPDVIIHAAANANARWCEAHPKEAYALNAESTKHIVAAANEVGAKVLLISSFAAMEPTNIYGQTKEQSETYVKQSKKGYIILRPSLIIGFSPNALNDRPFNRILKNLDQKTEAIYDTSWKFQPTYLGHLSEVIIQILKKNIINETIPVTVKELKSRYDIAKDILTPFGIAVTPIDRHDTSAITTDDLAKLEELDLPQYTYQEIIEKIINEIKNRKLFETI